MISKLPCRINRIRWTGNIQCTLYGWYSTSTQIEKKRPPFTSPHFYQACVPKRMALQTDYWLLLWHTEQRPSCIIVSTTSNFRTFCLLYIRLCLCPAALLRGVKGIILFKIICFLSELVAYHIIFSVIDPALPASRRGVLQKRDHEQLRWITIKRKNTSTMLFAFFRHLLCLL